jgi:hypothetical protein
VKHALWGIVQAPLTVAWTTGRGNKSKVAPKDAFFMTLCVLKHYSTWDKHAMDFSINPSKSSISSIIHS